MLDHLPFDILAHRLAPCLTFSDLLSLRSTCSNIKQFTDDLIVGYTISKEIVSNRRVYTYSYISCVDGHTYIQGKCYKRGLDPELLTIVEYNQIVDSTVFSYKCIWGTDDDKYSHCGSRNIEPNTEQSITVKWVSPIHPITVYISMDTESGIVECIRTDGSILIEQYTTLLSS